MSRVALLDACVLYSAPLRDLLMSLATARLYRPKWSDQIQDEWIRNVLASRPDLKREQLEWTRSRMEIAVRDSKVTGYEAVVDGLTLPDPNDRHVLAAAITARADVLVTYNLKDFPSDALSAYSIVAQHPDDFLVSVIDTNEARALKVVNKLRQKLKSPPVMVQELFATWEKLKFQKTVERLRPFADDL